MNDAVERSVKFGSDYTEIMTPIETKQQNIL